MKKLFLSLILSALGIISITNAQDSFPINDLPGAQIAPGITITAPQGAREFTATNCNDLTQPISIRLGQPSPDPGSPERVGMQYGRIFRDAIASSCPSKPYPGSFNLGNVYGYHAIQFSNCSGEPVCITVNVNLNSADVACGTNAHGHVYQSSDGLNPAPYDPLNQSVNFLGDLGSSISQPFSVTVNPGFFEVVFTNTAAVSPCELEFSITVPEENAGAINCQCEHVPVSNWALIFGAMAVVVFTVIRARRNFV